ncbi:SH3 domain-containing protein [Halomicronema sp. CCY15110]|uniref:SH3 domain-containing protein n=1 Tax=Halomicronema sp. CCY15110 TaxID=2767773 RepID=UPI00195177BA|nr:SH3 domain-containing protein [Halomicronema sp. CCY15110]
MASGSAAIAQSPDCGDGIPLDQVERPNVGGFLDVAIVGEDPGSSVNVRAEPTLASAVVLQVRVGDRLFASARQYAPDSGGAAPGAVCELWYLVQATELLGWVRGDLIGVDDVAWSRQP